MRSGLVFFRRYAELRVWTVVEVYNLGECGSALGALVRDGQRTRCSPRVREVQPSTVQ
jgi:hypothetical protein